VPQTHLVSTQRSCIPCDRTFKDASALYQHLQNSKSHIAAALPPPQAQNVQIHTISRQTSLSTPYERQTSLVDVNDSRARTSQTLNHLGPISSEQLNPWVVDPRPNIGVMLENLARYCHSPEDLLKNRYPLSPYSEKDIAGLRKCRKCGRKS
jgi:hypothetical protein